MKVRDDFAARSEFSRARPHGAMGEKVSGALQKEGLEDTIEESMAWQLKFVILQGNIRTIKSFLSWGRLWCAGKYISVSL